MCHPNRRRAGSVQPFRIPSETEVGATITSYLDWEEIGRICGVVARETRRLRQIEKVPPDGSSIQPVKLAGEGRTV